MGTFIKLLMLCFFFCSGWHVHAIPCVADLFKTMKRQFLLSRYGHYPESIRRVLALTGLKVEDIEDSVILDVGSFHTEDFVVYAKKEMGAKQAFFVNILLSRPLPRNFFLQMHPSFMEGANSGFIEAPPFQPEEIWQRLGGTYADISLSLGVIGTESLWATEAWLRQLTKITKDGGMIIFNFGKHRRKIEYTDRSELEEILLRMENKGIIASYEVQHKNRRRDDSSITYKIVNGPFQPRIRLGELQGNAERSQSEEDVIIPFSNK